ncbi:MAG: Type 1 glutamine amidotransferase-like domain-containing protein [Deltaproteobacteria bacterium]|nr:Type 1 glutamine amidotransferase-like domain-containing protein [Deltaproteobacteria bacterium]MBK9367020.1 Type 1 glutamine amidotransferase-like domain-containing protein [Deltaproteobacteria bacterium]
MSAPLYVLGPQRPLPNLPQALQSLPGHGPIVMITAGWRHDEADTEALQRDIGPSAVALPLYAWFEELMEHHHALHAVYRARQAQVQTLKELHRVRMELELAAWRQLLEQHKHAPQLVDEELADAMRGIRALDERFLRRSETIQAEYNERLRHLEPPALTHRREEARALLCGARAICVAGGHVGVLRNRMLFFGLDRALAEAWRGGTSVVAWSAGAMALCDRVVLFNDDTPEGPQDDELLDTGLGFLPGLVVLPHAKKRLHLDNTARVRLIAERFAPLRCVGLESGAWLSWTGDGWLSRGVGSGTLSLCPTGEIAPTGDGLMLGLGQDRA